MDIQRIESVAVPTALAATGAGIAGYVIPKTIKVMQHFLMNLLNF